MATKFKTIEFVTTTDVTVRAATVFVEKPITIYIPEGNPTFISCVLEVYTSKEVDTASLTSPELGIDDGSVSWDDLVMTAVPGSSSESELWVFRRDVTAFFIANFDGATPPTSATWDVRFRSSDNTGNHAFKLILTYEYDDTTTTQIKTIKIPISSDTSTLGTSYTTVGGATSIPDIGGSYLPEASVTVRQVWLEMMAAGNGGSARDVDLRINGGSDVRWFEHDVAGGEPVWHYGQVDITAEDLTAARSLEAKSSLTSSVGHLGGFVCVTYEFNADTSNKIYNSIRLSLKDFIGWAGHQSGDGNTRNAIFNIQEPLTADATPDIETMESSVTIYSMDDSDLSVGAQSTQNYSLIDATSTGQGTYVHRWDAASPRGDSGIVLARGENIIDVYIEPSTVNDSAFYGYVTVNYISGKATDGVGSHNHTVFKHVNDPTNSEIPVSGISLILPDTFHYINDIHAEVINHSDNFVETPFLVFNIERLVAEGGPGWETFVNYNYFSQTENRHLRFFNDLTKLFRQWPEQTNSSGLMDLSSTRRYSASIKTEEYWTADLYVTYHAIVSDATVGVYNYTGDGSGITVRIQRTDIDVVVDEVTTAIGGTAIGKVYDDTLNYRAIAQQSTRSGASLEGTI